MAAELGFDESAARRAQPGVHPVQFAARPARARAWSSRTRACWQRITAANRGLRIGPADRIVWILPMAHHFAVSIMLYLRAGATTLIVNSHLAEDVLAAARRHGGTVLYGAPFHHALLAAEAFRPAVADAAAGRFRRRRPAAEDRAGIRRALRRAALAGSRDHRGRPAVAQPARPPARNPGRSAGRCRIIRRRFARGGELYLRGPGMFDAYLRPWRRRAGPCWRTAGSARATSRAIDADGDVFLLGRSHSVINVGGLKCFPEEIEAVLCEVPGVAAARTYRQGERAVRRGAGGGNRAARSGAAAASLGTGHPLPAGAGKL